MNIDRRTRARVSGAPVVAPDLTGSGVAGGALRLARAHARAEAGSDGAAGLVALGWTAIGVAGLIVLYGLYLLIPYFH